MTKIASHLKNMVSQALTPVDDPFKRQSCESLKVALNTNREGIAETFAAVAKGDTLKIGDAPQLLANLEQTLSFDISPAVHVFNKSYKHFPKDIDPNAITLDQFHQLIKLWMTKRKWNVPEEFKVDQLLVGEIASYFDEKTQGQGVYPDDLEEFLSNARKDKIRRDVCDSIWIEVYIQLMEGEEEEQIDEDTFLGVLERSAEDLEKAKTEIRPNEPSASVVCDKNEKLLTQVWGKHQKEVKKSFDKLAQLNTITYNQYPKFLKNLFDSIDHGLYKNKHDVKNYFAQKGHEAVFENRAKLYYLEKEQEDEEEDSEEEREDVPINQEDLMSILVYYLQEDANVTVRTPEEIRKLGKKGKKKVKTKMSAQEIKQRKMRQKMAETVQQYEDLIYKCDDPQEKVILEKTLQTLQLQLNKIDKVQAKKYEEKEDFDLKLNYIDDEIKELDKRLQAIKARSNFDSEVEKIEKQRQQIKQQKRVLYQERAIVRSEKKQFMIRKYKENMTEEKVRKKALKSLFTYLCRQQQELGGFPTLEENQQILHTFTLSNFMIFCRKYNVMWHPRENRTGVKADKLQIIFKRYAVNTKKLDFKGFEKAINVLAIEYFKPREDKKLGLKVKVPFWKPKKEFKQGKIDWIKKTRVKCNDIKNKAVKAGELFEIPKTVIKEKLTISNEDELRVTTYFKNSLNQKYLKGQKQLGYQHIGKVIYQKQEKVEAKWKADSKNWSTGIIKSHNDYFTEFLVYFDDGRTRKIPPEQIRKLSPYEIDDDLTDEAKVMRFYEILGCNKIENVKKKIYKPTYHSFGIVDDEHFRDQIQKKGRKYIHSGRSAQDRKDTMKMTQMKMEHLRKKEQFDLVYNEDLKYTQFMKKYHSVYRSSLKGVKPSQSLLQLQQVQMEKEPKSFSTRPKRKMAIQASQQYHRPGKYSSVFKSYQGMAQFKGKVFNPQNHVTWQNLQEYDNTNLLDELIEVNEHDDAEYLQEYKIVNPIEKKISDGYKLEEYGRISKQPRPSQIYMLEQARKNALMQQQRRGKRNIIKFKGKGKKVKNSTRNLKANYRNRSVEVSKQNALKRRNSLRQMTGIQNAQHQKGMRVVQRYKR